MKQTPENPTKETKRRPNPGTDGGGEGGTSGAWGGGATEGTDEAGTETPAKAPARKVHPWRKYRGKTPRPQ